MTTKHALTADDIVPTAEYAPRRTEHRRRIAARKRNRRVEVGPVVTFYFECWESMWLQVQEMLYIEKGGAEQLADELEAYNPLIPQGMELVATFMVEIDDPIRRRRIIRAQAETDQDRTTAEGKASSVQFVHFPFTADQVAAFCSPGAEVVLGFDHQNYRHMTILPEEVRAELTGDFA